VVVGFVIMAFRSLLLCEDEATARLVGRVFRDLGVDMEHVTGTEIAVEKIKQGSFDAVVVDDANPTGAALVLETARSLTSSKKCLGIVLAQSQTSLGVAFGAGTHLVIYKPIAAERVRSGLTAVRNLMGRKHRRTSPRVRVEIEATLSREGKAERRAVIIDLSEGGAALRIDGSLAASEPINLACVLPGTSDPFNAKAEIVWRDAQGWLGVRFSDLAGDSQRLLREWVNRNSKTQNQIANQKA
jgi:ActR/RegA family two-component response regulator